MLNKQNILILWSIILSVLVIHLIMDNRELEQRVNHSKYMINKLNTDVEMVRQDNILIWKEFETFVDLTSEEFERTWVSFGHMRDNFRAIGYSLEYGLHLEDKDKISKEDLKKEQLRKEELKKQKLTELLNE